MSVSMKYCDNCGAPNRLDARFCYVCGQAQATYSSTQTGLLSTFYTLKQRYRILDKIGQGGFGAIYLVEDLLFNNVTRAVKEMGIRSLYGQEMQQAITAFKKEAMLLANLSHPNLPNIYDHFEDHGRWYLVMDYIQGETLEEHLDTSPLEKLPIPETLEIALQLCHVLAYLHDHQPAIIFRDLKPANVMLTRTNQLYLIDFGIARFFTPGQSKDTVTLGTPGYAAPEQYGRVQTTTRSDIYSLGATLYHLISGIFPGLHPFLFQPLDLDPQISGNRELEQLIMQMLELKEERRPQSIEFIEHALLKIQDMRQAPPVPVQTVLSSINKASTPPSIESAPTLATDPPPSLIVDQQGGGQYTTLSEAIQNAVPGTFILVREGTYSESLVLDKDIEIIGNGPRERIIIECLDSHCVLMQTNRAVMRGLTIHCRAEEPGKRSNALAIIRGQLFVEDCDISSRSSSAIAIYNAETRPTLRYCRIHDSAAEGIVVSNGAQAIIEYCDIFQNGQSQVTISSQGNPTFRHCTIHHSPKYGVFVHNGGQGTFEDCQIHSNGYSGVAITSQSNPLLLRCLIQYNQQHGVAIQQKGKGSVQDCDISFNAADNVLIAAESTPYLYLSKIHDSEQCGVSIRNTAKGTLEYCDIRANRFANILIAGEPLIHACNIVNGLQNGITIQNGAQGTVDQCTISGNKGKALEIAPQSSVILKRNYLQP
jgi:F-box protein 11